MSELKAEGLIIKIGELNQVSEKFTKLEFVIETEEKYPQFVTFQLTQSRCDDMQHYKVGDRAIVHFNLRGREWRKPETNEIKYFNTLECWRLEKKEATATVSGSSEPTADTFSESLPF